MLEALHTHLTETLSPETWADVLIAEDIDILREMAGQVQDGSAIIMPWGERASPNERATGGTLQRVEVQFLTGIVQRDHSSREGAERAKRVDTLKTDIEAAVLGWAYADFEPCELIGGETSPISQGVSIYVQTWATARFLTGAS